MRSGTSRRRFLAGTALAGVGFLAGTTRSGRTVALSLDPPDTEAAALYSDRCSADTTHARLVAEILAKLEGKARADEVAAALSGLSCPLCGCRLG